MPNTRLSSAQPQLSPAPKLDTDDANSRLSDIALRKKKNADAQAAFRQRRANYISTLEETVTSLESVVLQLQDSCREARTEATELRQDNARLRHDLYERENFYKALLQARKGQPLDAEDLPSLPPSFAPIQSPSNNLSAHVSNPHIDQYSGKGIRYRSSDDPSSAMGNGPYNAGPSHVYPSQSPSLSYAGMESEHIDAAQQMVGHRIPKYTSYPYSVQTSDRDGSWPHGITPTTSSGGESGAPASAHSSHSPGYVESPTLTASDMPYVGRYHMEEQKHPLNGMDTAPYVFPSSRSLSPSASTPPSSSSTSLTSAFPFTFPEATLNPDRPDLDFRRHSSTHGAEMTLHGGTADISLGGLGGDGVRYRLNPRRTNSGPDRPLLPALPTFTGSDNGSVNEPGSSEGESNSYNRQPKQRSRRGAVSQESRSPSPPGPPISGTLAVIKAQAFGALRRTRARTKKSSEGAAKVALEALEARGLGMGVSTGSKRPRLHNDDHDMHT